MQKRTRTSASLFQAALGADAIVGRQMSQERKWKWNRKNNAERAISKMFEMGFLTNKLDLLFLLTVNRTIGDEPNGVRAISKPKLTQKCGIGSTAQTAITKRLKTAGWLRLHSFREKKTDNWKWAYSVCHPEIDKVDAYFELWKSDRDAGRQSRQAPEELEKFRVVNRRTVINDDRETVIENDRQEKSMTAARSKMNRHTVQDEPPRGSNKEYQINLTKDARGKNGREISSDPPTEPSITVRKVSDEISGKIEQLRSKAKEEQQTPFYQRQKLNGLN